MMRPTGIFVVRSLNRCDDPIELVLSRTAVALIAFPDNAKTSEAIRARSIDLNRNDHAVNGSSVGKDCFDVSKINADGYRASPLKSALLSEFDKAFPIKVGKAKVSERAIKKSETRALGAADPFADLL